MEATDEGAQTKIMHEYIEGLMDGGRKGKNYTTKSKKQSKRDAVYKKLTTDNQAAQERIDETAKMMGRVLTHQGAADGPISSFVSDWTKAAKADLFKYTDYYQSRIKR